MSHTHPSPGRWGQWRDPVVLLVAVALLVLQEVAVSHVEPGGEWAWLRRVLFFGSTPLMVLAALHFRGYAGAWLIAGGIALNFLPMAMHGGNMPVAYETVRDAGVFPEITETQIGGQIANSKDVVLWRDDVRLFPLSDNIVLTVPGYRTNIYSPGDAVIAAGVVLAAAEAGASLLGVSMRRSVRRQPRPDRATVQ